MMEEGRKRNEQPETAGALFGFDSTPGVVAVEIDGSEAVLLRADLDAPAPSSGAPRREERRPFRPWLLTTEEGHEEHGEALGAAWTQLSGSGLVWLGEFPSWGAFGAARERLRSAGTPHHAYGSPVKQFLVRSGVTLFHGMDFGQVRRVQFDLETTSLSPTEPHSRILLIAVGDNRGGAWALAGEDEAAILREFVALIQELDPDVLEGHNLFGFDVPFLVARAQARGVPLTLGRNGAPPTIGRERNVPVGGISRPFRPAMIWGRHLIDTLFGVQRFDVGRGELDSYALKSAAVHYGLAASERIYLDRADITRIWKEDPERVRRYANQDVEETRRLAALVMPTEFYQTQMVPDTYQSAATGGSGEKINSLLVRAYLHQGYGIPLPQPAVSCPGGHTEIRETGVLRRVVKADVESLYPSIMLAYGIRPEGDSLQVFLPMLRELTARRIAAKATARAGGPDAAYWDGLQSSFKILINSFYGYLGAMFHFNDYRAAAQVTTTGQTLVKLVADELERTGSRVIEIDTDGVYFVAPDEVASSENEVRYVERVGAVLPAGIRLAHDGSYAAMVSLKVKNYVLVGHDGKKTLRGASLRSRADEAFGKEFLSRAVDRLISGDEEGLAEDYRELSRRIQQGLLPVEQLMRRERVTEKTFRSTARRRSGKVARGIAVGETMYVYQRVDGDLGLADDYCGDEDRWHYLDKLFRFASRLEGALGDRFLTVCPKPVRKWEEARMAGQGVLFDDL